MAVPHRREGLERRDVAPRVNHQAFHSPSPLYTIQFRQGRNATSDCLVRHIRPYTLHGYTHYGYTG